MSIQIASIFMLTKCNINKSNFLFNMKTLAMSLASKYNVEWSHFTKIFFMKLPFLLLVC